MYLNTYLNHLYLNTAHHSMYRHPKAPLAILGYIQDVFKMICIKNKSIFILGDFNDNLLSNTNKMDRTVNSVKLTQLIKKPTRITPTSSTLLYIVIKKVTTSIISCDVTRIEIEDHDLICVAVDILSKPKRTNVVRTYRYLRIYLREDFCSKLLENV